MRVASRRCAYCNLLRAESAFASFVAPDGKRIIETVDRQCESAMWPALVAEYPQLRRVRDLLSDVAWRAEPAAPSKAWDEVRIVTPLREGQKPDGVTDDGRTLKTAANSQPDRYYQKWVNRRLGEVYQEIEDKVYPPDPSENAKPKRNVPPPRCQKGSCNHRGKVGDTFCGKCGSEFTVRKEAANAN